MIQIKEFLTQAVAAHNWLQPQTKRINGYVSLDDFLLRNGRYWKPHPRPSEVHKGKAKECYCNSAHLVLDRPELIYCEGYVTSVIPVMHAWAVDKDGHVIETTLKETAEEYFGIAFSRRYLIRSLARNKYYGLLDNWVQGWPILSAPTHQWRHPLMDKNIDSFDGGTATSTTTNRGLTRAGQTPEPRQRTA